MQQLLIEFNSSSKFGLDASDGTEDIRLSLKSIVDFLQRKSYNSTNCGNDNDGTTFLKDSKVRRYINKSKAFQVLVLV